MKIERALSRLPGASEVSVDYGRQLLAINLDDSLIAPGDVAAQIRALGFSTVDAPREGPFADGASPVTAWWQSPKALVVAITGALLAVAYLLATARPDWSQWLFAAAALAGLMPSRAVPRRRPAPASLSASTRSCRSLLSVPSP